MSLFATTPSSQKASDKPISFLLWNTLTNPAPTEIMLAVRPEELTRTDPSRVAVQQTLGGAFGDSFGPGLSMINISGNTAWRAGADGNDGVARFLALKASVFDQWHAQRALAVTAGNDPNQVQLIFLDHLDQIGAVVIPNQFVLRRSKSRPLLMMYQISMTVIAEPGITASSPLASALGASTLSLGLASLTSSINSITSYALAAQNFINRELLAPVQSFMTQTAQLYSSVNRAIASVDGIASSLINVAATTAQAGANLFHTLAAVADLPSNIMSQLMGVASAYTNVLCLLKNAFSGQSVYQDYTPLFGASNCSSTNGGSGISAFAGENPFYSVFPMSANLTPLTLTTQAQTSMTVLANSDPVLAPMSQPVLTSTVTSIANGMTVTA